MITFTDIHYLVWLLSRVSENKKNIDIEIGSEIYDSVWEINRDIDVTISFTDDDDNKNVFKWIEVKDHSRPLTIEHAEQLCQKFNDLEWVTHKAIVSSSGYTASAIKKCSKNGIDLYEIVDAESIDFPYGKIPADTNFKEKLVSCQDWWTIQIIPEKGYQIPIKSSTDLVTFYLNWRELPTIKNADALGRYIISSFDTSQIEEFEWSKSITISEPIENFTVRIKGKIYRIDTINVHCVMDMQLKKMMPTFKVMRKVWEKEPFVGCLIWEFNNWSLMGIALSKDNKNINFIKIPLSDRIKKKIKEQKLLNFSQTDS